jgi:hypothetical protein
VANARDRRNREFKNSPAGLALELRDLRREGREYLKHRPRKVEMTLTVREVEMLEKYGRRD